MALIIDFETRSQCSLKECGPHVYAEHESTEMLLLAYKIDDAPVHIWEYTASLPMDLSSAIRQGRNVWAWNAAFDRVIWERFMAWMEPITPEQWRDVMALAAYRAMPMGLGDFAEVAGLPQNKDKAGAALITKYCRPDRKGRFREIPAEDWDALKAYAAQDVETTAAALEYLKPELPRDELRWWLLEQEINTRGVAIDIPTVERCIELVERETAAINAELTEITGGAITSAGQAERIASAVGIEDCKAETVKDALKTDLDPLRRRLLELRTEGGKASIKKLYRMRQGANADGRARGLLQYHGATTGREAGRRVQPQNLPRPEFEVNPDIFMSGTVEEVAELVLALYGSCAKAVASALRHLIVADPGNVLMAGDFSAVEARVNAALAGETSKLSAFVDVDEGRAEDIYCITAAGIYGRPISKKKDPVERQVGKIAELASGYQGGVGAWKRFGADRLGWGDDAIREKVKAWRATHPRIVASWYAYAEGAAAAVRQPGRAFTSGPVAWVVWRDWLLCRLPSGRHLHYFKPAPALDSFENPTFSFWANKQMIGGGRAWRQVAAYGGLLCENIVQAVSRDLMVAAAHRCEEAGIPVVLTVHDELVCEVPADRADPGELERIMSVTPAWAQGWPIRAEAWCDRRYRK